MTVYITICHSCKRVWVEFYFMRNNKMIDVKARFVNHKMSHRGDHVQVLVH